MSDTSGGSRLGSAGRKIRSNLKDHYGGGRAPSGSSTRRSGEPPTRLEPKAAGPATRSAVLPAILWQPLDEEDLLKALLLPPELVFYLQQVATIVETARRAGLEAVASGFGVREVSMFPSIRRAIKVRAPGNSESRREASEHHDRAGAAFDSGSARWAQELSGIDDPPQIPIQMLVDRIRSTADEYARALKLSARLIIQEYGERVIRAAIREDDSFRRAAETQLITEFRAQLDRFFAEHASPNDWTAARLRETVATLPDFLKR